MLSFQNILDLTAEAKLIKIGKMSKKRIYFLMTTIGVYDSGIGGLTTLKILIEKFDNCRFYYLSDNANHPFGNKKQKDVEEIVFKGVKKLKCHCDIPVLACNTASTAYKDKNVFMLLPPVNSIPANEKSQTLLMATPNTQKKIEDADLKRAETEDLASLIEIQAAMSVRKGTIDMQNTLPYLAQKVFPFKGVKNVILGCSHYPFCKKQISKILGDVKYFDGNSELCRQLERHLYTATDYLYKSAADAYNTVRENDEAVSPSVSCAESDDNCYNSVEFDFTGGNEAKLYRRILSILLSQRDLS